MPRFNVTRFIEVTAPDGTRTLVADASSLGLPPGSWPSSFYLDRDGAGYAYTRLRADCDPEGDVAGMQYAPAPGQGMPEILIVND